MDSKLNRSLAALSATSLVLAVVLLAAGPAPRVDAGTPVQQAGATGPDAGEDLRRGEAPRARAARRSLALPYFSFARGLRRAGGPS